MSIAECDVAIWMQASSALALFKRAVVAVLGLVITIPGDFPSQLGHLARNGLMGN